MGSSLDECVAVKHSEHVLLAVCRSATILHLHSTAEMMALLQNRDKAKCTMKQMVALTPYDNRKRHVSLSLRTCPQTKLPYQECCGRDDKRLGRKANAGNKAQFATA